MATTKAIILAGGAGTRLYPCTQVISKQLLPVYDKPMIYYPLCTSMLAGCRDILIVTTTHEQALFKRFLGDGAQWGLNFSYVTQDKPRGIADAFRVGASFIGRDHVFLILGDNLIFGHELGKVLIESNHQQAGGIIFAFKVKDPERYGVLGFDQNGKVNQIVEKPTQPPSHYAVSGLYFYDQQVVDIARDLKPSARGELEISDINAEYLRRDQLTVKRFNRGVAWLDTGTVNSMLDAGKFIQILEQRQGLRIGCPEELAWRQGYIDDQQLENLAQPLLKSGYGTYLLELLHESK
ncbi:MAG: glucose-1-phosphate thymidylyltransferase RfbA [Pseudomonadota bacterium]